MSATERVRDSLLAQFQDVTGVDAERASFYLESSRWNLEMALGSFYENGPPSPERPATHSGGEGLGFDTGPAVGGAGGARNKDPPRQPVRRGVGGNVGTIFDTGIEEDDDEEEEEQGQAFYAGGSTTSGQQILGPAKKKGADAEKFVKEVFKKAKEHGAEVTESSSQHHVSSSTNAFTGVGFRLGSDAGNSEKILGASKPRMPRNFILKMWKNGFCIDDGELREYDEPSNRAFLASVMMGRIPRELEEMADGGEVHVDMEDHKEEEYTKKKANLTPFSGAGHVLGGIVPEMERTVEGCTASLANYRKQEAQKVMNVDNSRPVTSIQIRVPDGKRLVVNVNHQHTVADIRTFILTARPDMGAFSLHTTFPPKELADTSITVEKAGLVGASILLRKI